MKVFVRYSCVLDKDLRGRNVLPLQSTVLYRYVCEMPGICTCSLLGVNVVYIVGLPDHAYVRACSKVHAHR